MTLKNGDAAYNRRKATKFRFQNSHSQAHIPTNPLIQFYAWRKILSLAILIEIRKPP
jgi:hypothetical protein